MSPKIRGILALINATISRFSPLALTLLCARWLNEDAYGLYATFAVTASSIATLSAFGIGVACNIVTAKHFPDDRNFVSAVFTSTLAICFVLSAVISLLMSQPILNIESSPPPSATIGVLFLLALTMSSVTAFEGIIYGIDELPLMLAITFLAMVISLTSAIHLIPNYGLTGALSALVLQRLTVFGLSLWLIGHRASIFISFAAVLTNRTRISSVLRSLSLPTAMAGILAAPMVAFVVFYMEYHLGLGAVAEFSLGYQFFLLAVFAPAALANFLLSRSSQNRTNSESLLFASIKPLAIFGATAGTALTLLAPLATLLVTDEFTLRTSLVAGFGMGVFLFCPSTAFNSYWPAIGFPKYLFFAQIGWAIGLGSSLLILTPLLGVAAAGFAFSIGAFCHLSVNVFLFNFRRHIP